jgi:hypothetical protein
MFDHFSCLGLPVATPEAFEKFVEFVAYSGAPIETQCGYYIRWSPGAGVDVWAQATLNRELAGCNPHFAGDCFIYAELVTKIQNPESPLDGSLQVMVKSTSEEGNSADLFPVLIDVPDFCTKLVDLPIGTAVRRK